MPSFSSVLIGHQSLAVQCGQMLLDAGHPVRAVVSRHPDVREWAKARGLMLVEPGPGLAGRLQGLSFDWLFSVANLDMLPPEVLALSAKGGINFHDGPLPRYAGLNAPVWAIRNGEVQHGITWHLLTAGADEGDIVEQRLFDIVPGETALTLNTKCYAAGMESFGAVIAQLADGGLDTQPQDMSRRSYFARDQRPAHAGMIDFAESAASIAALVRSLDHGTYANPLTCAKVMLGGQVAVVGSAEVVDENGRAGTILSVNPAALTVAADKGAVRLSGLRSLDGLTLSPVELVREGDMIASPADGLAQALNSTIGDEGFWRDRLLALNAAIVPKLGGARGTGPLSYRLTDPTGGADGAFATLVQVILESSDAETADFALVRGGAVRSIVSDWTPVRADLKGPTLATALAEARARAPFAADLRLRLGSPAPAMPQVAFSDQDGLHKGSVLTLSAQAGGAVLHGDPTLISPQAFALIAARVDHRLAHPDAPQTLSDSERALVVQDWNATEREHVSACIHHLIEAQAERTPDAQALVFEGVVLTYDQMNRRANRMAHNLRALGVKSGTLVGLHLHRSADLVVGALAILKAGGAYVPLDPAYPADRVALYIEDSGAPVILTQSALKAGLPAHNAQILLIDDPDLPDTADANPDSGVAPDSLAYLIYTSGSTGRPKGVMIEHRNVSNFFVGMDDRIAHDPPGSWLAVTSLSFDISVLELLWTLTKGFKVVVSNDESRKLMSSAPVAMTGRGMQFSLFYWGNDDGVGRDKYRLLLEGAKYADQTGFTAVWTPERHFHAFGGPYPNPSVTGAAVAAVTQNLGVRGGSCVAPLHHPARIAEEWAVIDNLTGGRAGIAIASGWQPDDFVLRPENTPPHNKPAMFDAIAKLRALWVGEAVEFPTASGTMFPVVTQPRPVSKTLPIWVTTAGNPETWREAGSIGANVLTHLLGQSVDEVKGKIAIYHDALRSAGHDPANHTVTLMLHTYLAASRDAAREIAREPMKDYLRSAAALIKQYAWAFPAFKKPAGVTNAMQIDLGSLEPDELESILDFAFMRYFDESGLFGTIEDAVSRVEDLKRIGVDEIACLIDYGIAVDTVLDGLRPLAEVLRQTNQMQGANEADYSIAANIVRHGVTHLQCTPSMARMLVTNDDSRMALSRVKHLMIGGEALPGALVADVQKATAATITNMYGPTETTIWSTTQTATAGDGVTGIGRPIANTQVYVLDEVRQPVPVGIAGELYIGGDGVARGYWQRPDLTAERFLPDPFRAANRMYRTGDLVRWNADGALDFLGRADHQVKLRGYRIELGEIESAVDAQAGIRQSVVMAREDVPGLVQLVAYYTAASEVDEAAVKAALARSLPEHMIPSRFVRVDDFPLTPNKKVDRKALPAPSSRAETPVAAPQLQEGSQAAIAAIWQRILGVQTVAPRDSFFDLGGHSLLAVQAHRDIRDRLSVSKLSITDIFRFPTLGALAARVDELRIPAGTPPPDASPGATLAEDDRAAARTDAMSRRREMRARRQG